MRGDYDNTKVAPIVLLVLGGILVLVVMAASTLNKNQPLTYNSSAANCATAGGCLDVHHPDCCSGLIKTSATGCGAIPVKCVIPTRTPTPSSFSRCSIKGTCCPNSRLCAYSPNGFYFECRGSSCIPNTPTRTKTPTPTPRCSDAQCTTTEKLTCEAGLLDIYKKCTITKRTCSDQTCNTSTKVCKYPLTGYSFCDLHGGNRCTASSGCPDGYTCIVFTTSELNYCKKVY